MNAKINAACEASVKEEIKDNLDFCLQQNHLLDQAARQLHKAANSLSRCSAMAMDDAGYVLDERDCVVDVVSDAQLAVADKQDKVRHHCVNLHLQALGLKPLGAMGAKELLYRMKAIK